MAGVERLAKDRLDGVGNGMAAQERQGRTPKSPPNFFTGRNKMANSVWKGFLSFGLLSIPVTLKVAARSKRVDDMHGYHTACNSQIKMPKFCPKCEVILQPTEIFKAFDAGSGIVKLEDSELESITPATERI